MSSKLSARCSPGLLLTGDHIKAGTKQLTAPSPQPEHPSARNQFNRSVKLIHQQQVRFQDQVGKANVTDF